MTNQEFVDALAVMCGFSWWPANINERKLYINVGRANYGNPSFVVIEFEGSPSVFQIFMGDLSVNKASRRLLVSSKTFKGGRQCAKACELIEKFLTQHKVIE